MHFDVILTFLSDHCTIFSGIFEGIPAHLASDAEFDTLHLAGSGASGSVLSEPDLSAITLDESANTARMTVAVSNVPIIADADSGFGCRLKVARIITLYESTGIAGCHIENQTFCEYRKDWPEPTGVNDAVLAKCCV